MKMTSQKAIELLRTAPIRLKTPEDHDLYHAIQMGVQALERHQRAIIGFRAPQEYLLAGECLQDTEKP